jgi:hypothetical protein
MTTYIDTNIVIDLLDDASAMHEACVEKFVEAQSRGQVLISDIVYAETSVGMPNKEAIDHAVQSLGLSRIGFNDIALFSAGRAYKKYKDDNGGIKNNVLPDFFIGAQTDEHGCPLITSDIKRMSGYFPTLSVIQP